MQIQKIQNNNYNPNFKGFEFKNTYAQKVFENKLNRYSKDFIKNIKNYMDMTANEPAKIIIDATHSRTNTGEHILFATFSNNDKFIVEKTSTPRIERLKEFISRCTVQAGYKSYKGI